MDTLCAFALPVLFLSEDWNDRWLEDGDLHQSFVLLGGLAVIVGHHQQLPGKHNIQLTFHGVTGVAQTHHGVANAAKDNTNTPVIRSPGCESMLSAWELQSRMCVPPGGVLIGSCFSFPLPLIGRQPRLTGPKGSLIRDNLKYHNIKAVVIYIALTFL